MDGVLVDSEKFILKAAKASLLKWGIEAEDKDFLEFVGAGEDRFVGGVAEKHGHKYVHEMKDEAYRIYGELVKGEPIAYKNAGYLISELKKLGLKTAVCSSADMVKVKINVSALGLPENTIDYIVSGLDVERKKPFPDIYLLGAEKLGCKPSECIVVEDAVNGVRAAHAAGMKCIAVTTSFSEEVLKKEAAPDFIVSELSEILSLFR